jgi:signal transduction histidine kinase/CheY-like chemotaxis protein
MAQLQAALAASQALLWTCDASGHLTYTNFSSILAAPEGERPLETLLVLVEPSDRQNRARDLRAALVDRRGATSYFLAQLGSARPVAFREEIDPVWQGDDFQGLIGVAVPCPEIPAAEAEAGRQSRRQLAGTELAALNHEVRNCLAGLAGTLELLQEASLEEAPGRQLAAARESCDTLLSLLESSLDAYRLESGLIRAQREPFDPVRTARRAVTMLEKMARDKGVQMRLAVAPTMPSLVMGDPHRLSRVLTNLLANGVKYTDRGVVTLSLDPSESGVQFTVRDNGPGLGFPFPGEAQMDIVRQTAVQGTGLGLSLSDRMVKAMGGRTSCHSDDSGTTFVFWLPLPSLDEPPVSHVAPRLSASEPRALRVLVVEDQPLVQNVLMQQLEKLGLTSFAVDNGKGALEMLQSLPMDLILMDLHLPKLGGFETSRQIRQRFGDRPVIVGLTGQTGPGVRRQCLEAGMDDCFFKPLSLDRLSRFLSERDWAPPAEHAEKTLSKKG